VAQRRHIIARELEQLASRVAAKLRAERRETVKARIVQEMRILGAPVEGIAEDTGLSREAVYAAFERKLEELMKPRVKVVPEVLPECVEMRKTVKKASRLLEEVRILEKLSITT
jgi:hypothetical protein